MPPKFIKYEILKPNFIKIKEYLSSKIVTLETVDAKILGILQLHDAIFEYKKFIPEYTNMIAKVKSTVFRLRRIKICGLTWIKNDFFARVVT